VQPIFDAAAENMQADILIDMQEYDMIDAASVLEDCLKTDGERYIEKPALEQASASGFSSFCGQKGYYLYPISGAKVTNIDTGESWTMGDFQENFPGSSHEIFVNIKEGDTVYVGRLYVHS